MKKHSILKHGLGLVAVLGLSSSPAMANIRVSLQSSGQGPDHTATFDVRSSVLDGNPPTEGLTVLVIRAYVTPGVETDLQLVPIADNDTVDCEEGSPCFTFGRTDLSSTGKALYYGIAIGGGHSSDIAVSTNDLCLAGLIQGAMPAGCVATQGDLAPAVQNGTIQLEFSVYDMIDTEGPLPSSPIDVSGVFSLKP